MIDKGKAIVGEGLKIREVLGVEVACKGTGDALDIDGGEHGSQLIKLNQSLIRRLIAKVGIEKQESCVVGQYDLGISQCARLKICRFKR